MDKGIEEDADEILEMEEEDEEEPEKANVQVAPLASRIYKFLTTNFFTCEWLDKIEINRELG